MRIVKLCNSQSQDIRDAKILQGSKTLHTNSWEKKKYPRQLNIKPLPLAANVPEEQMLGRVEHTNAALNLSCSCTAF